MGYPYPDPALKTVLEPLNSSDRASWPDPLRDLPVKFQQFRPVQTTAIRDILEAYQSGSRVVVLDAPPGSGKTLISETVRKMIGTSGLYICHTKSLQDQFANDFSYCAVLKGRSNYPTMREELFYDYTGFNRITAADCTKSGEGEDRVCIWCNPISQCPYESAKSTLLRSKLGCVNISYFLTEANYVGRLSRSPFITLDECDTAESELMGFIGVDFSERLIREWELGEPSRVTKEEAWIEWASGAQKVVGRLLQNTPPVTVDSDVQTIRRYNQLHRIGDDVERLGRGLQDGSWVYTGRDGRVSFKPVRVDRYGEQYLWRHGARFLLMSGSVISGTELMESLGGSGIPYSVVSLPSIFSVENRKVKVIGVGDLSRKALTDDREGQLNNIIEGIKGIIARHPGERMLVHTVSYDIASDLAVRMVGVGRETEGEPEPEYIYQKTNVFTYGNASERDRVLQAFTGVGEVRSDECGDNAENSILFAPSMDRGIDLPDDLCRVIIIVKVPYPYLGDRQVAARLYSHGGQTWYNVQTIRKIIQMTGRGVRHDTDWCVSYILDRNFYTGIWSKSRGLFPRWWTEALDWKDKL